MKIKSSVAAACFLPGRAKDLSALWCTVFKQTVLPINDIKKNRNDKYNCQTTVKKLPVIYLYMSVPKVTT